MRGSNGALKGMEDLIFSINGPDIICELSNNHKEIFEFFVNAGYKVFEFEQNGEISPFDTNLASKNGFPKYDLLFKK